MRRAVLACLAAIVVAGALFAAPASAQVHQPHGTFCEPTGIGTPPCEPAFTVAQEMAVIPEGLAGAGDLLVVDAGTQTIRRFKSDGEPDPFAALGANTIDGKGSGGCAYPPTPSTECDQTPQNGLSFGTQLNTQIAIAPAGAAAGTEGDIYVTQAGSPLIDIFSEAGKYLGQLTEAFNASHELKPFDEPCGVAVDPAGAVYVGDFAQIHKYVPTADPPLDADNSANWGETITDLEFPCSLAAGTKSLASGGSEGFLFAAEFNGGLHGGNVVKLDEASGAFQYSVREGGNNATVSINAATGHPYVALEKGFVANGEVIEYDASGASEAAETSHIVTGPPPLPVEGSVFGVAVSPTGSTEGDVYVSTRNSTHIGVWGKAEPQAPTIEEQAALSVSLKEATVSAKIGPEGVPTTYHVQYIDEASYEEEGESFAGPDLRETAEKSAGDSNVPVKVTEALPGLEQGTTYRWRFVATNACSPSEGACGTTEGEADGVPRLRTPIEHPFELLDGRVWEMSSPSEKENAELATESTPGILHQFSVKPQQASPDGEAVTYASFTSFGEEAQGAPATAQFLSRRGPGGWSTENISPIFEEAYLRDPFVGFSEDLEKAAAITFNPPLAPGAPGGFWNLYARDNPSGGYSTLTAAEPQVSATTPCLAFAGASQSFDRVLFTAVGEALLEGNPVLGSAANLYEWSAVPLDDVQALAVKATSGKYRLSFGSGGPGVSETGEIEATASAEVVRGALNSLTNVSEGGGSVAVTGGPGDATGSHPYLIGFDGGPLAERPQPPLEAIDTSLAGGGATATLTTLADGHLALASVLPNGAAATPASHTSFGAALSGLGFGVPGGKGCDMERALLRNAVSADGRRSFWTYNSPAVGEPLLARIADPGGGEGETVELDAKQGGSGVSGFGKYRGASRDGRYAFFTDVQPLTANANSEDLYRYDVEQYEEEKAEGKTPKPLADISAHTGEAAEVQGVLGVSEEGDYAYFAAKGVLTSTPNPTTGKSAEAGKPNLYAWHEGEVEPHFIATVSSGDSFDWSTDLSAQTARVSPNGRHLAFLSTASLTGYDNTDQRTGARDSEVYLYSFEDGGLSCASCNPSGARPTGPSSVPVWSTPYEQPRYLSDSGRLFFQSQDALDSFYDTNGTEGCSFKGSSGARVCEDVYEFEPAGNGSCTVASPTYSPFSGGCVELLSSGHSADASYLIDASESGRDVFLSTRQALVPQLDGDEAFDLYDAREGGTPPPAPPQVCEGEGCPGHGTAASPSATAGSAHFLGPGNPTPKSGGCPKGEREVRRHGKLRCVARKPHHRHGKKRKRTQRGGRAAR